MTSHYLLYMHSEQHTFSVAIYRHNVGKSIHWFLLIKAGTQNLRRKRINGINDLSCGVISRLIKKLKVPQYCDVV
jgi:hypothetical protein